MYDYFVGVQCMLILILTVCNLLAYFLQCKCDLKLHEHELR